MLRNSDSFIKLIQILGNSELTALWDALEEDLTVLDEVSLDDISSDERLLNKKSRSNVFFTAYPFLLIGGLTPLHFAVFARYIDDSSARLIPVLRNKKPELGDKKGGFIMTPNELESYLALHAKDKEGIETVIINLINSSKNQEQQESKLIQKTIDYLVEKHNITHPGQWKSLALAESMELEVGISRFSQNRAITFKDTESNYQIELKDGQLIVLDKNKDYAAVIDMEIKASIFKKLLSAIEPSVSNQLKSQFIKAYNETMKSEQSGMKGLLFGRFKNYTNHEDKTLEGIFFDALSGKGGERSRKIIEELWFAEDGVIKLSPLQIEILNKAIRAVNDVIDKKIPLISSGMPPRPNHLSPSSSSS